MTKEILLADFKRYNLNKVSVRTLFFVFISQPIPGLKYLTIFRLTQHYRKKNRLLFYFFFLWLRRLKVKYGIDISYRTQIGKGFYIGHFGQIVVHGDSVIGEYCNISQGVTIGSSNYGEKTGTPTIGNKVFMGPNSGVFGKVKIGNQVTIGANAVVVEDVDDGKTIIAGKSVIIDKDLSDYYIHNL